MPKNNFQKGMHLSYNGREHVIEERLPNNDLQIRDVANDKRYAISEGSLIDAWFDGGLEFLGDETTTVAQRRAKKALSTDVSALKEDSPKKKELKRRYAYVSAIIDLVSEGINKINHEVLEPLVTKVHESIKDPKRKPHWKTVYYSWYKTLINTGEDFRVLIPNYDEQGNYTRKFTGKDKLKFSEKDLEKAQCVADIVNGVIDKDYLTPLRLSVPSVHEIVVARIADENSYRSESDKLPIPSVRSIYGVIDQLDEYEVLKARWGKRIADIRCGVYKRGPRPTRPLERVEVDHTTLDLFVIDPATKMPIGRPTLTIAIDRYTRMVLGFYVSFNGPGFLSVSHCLRHAILPKTYVGRLFPDVKNIWFAYGIPELVVVDNGSEFHGDGFEDACLQLGFVVQYCPVKRPWFKAIVERYFRTLNQKLLHELPGTTFSNIFEKADYDPAKNAVIPLDTLLTAIHVFIIDYYSQRPHRGLKGIPARLWELATKKYEPTLPSKRDDVNVLLGEVEYRTIQNNGISLFNLVYNDAAVLARLRKGRRKERFKVKFDPADISVIYIEDHDNEKFIPIPAEDQEYTKGLSLWQHRVIQRYARKKLNRDADIVEYCLAKEKISQIIQRDWAKISKSGPRTLMARYLNIGQPNYGGHVEIAGPSEPQISSHQEGAGTPPLLNPLAAHSNGVSDIESAFVQSQPALAESDENGTAAITPLFIQPQVTQPTGDSMEQSAAAPKNVDKNRTSTKSLTTKNEPTVVHNSNDDTDDLDVSDWSVHELVG